MTSEWQRKTTMYECRVPRLMWHKLYCCLNCDAAPSESTLTTFTLSPIRSTNNLQKNHKSEARQQKMHLCILEARQQCTLAYCVVILHKEGKVWGNGNSVTVRNSVTICNSVTPISGKLSYQKKKLLCTLAPTVKKLTFTRFFHPKNNIRQRDKTS